MNVLFRKIFNKIPTDIHRYVIITSFLRNENLYLFLGLNHFLDVKEDEISLDEKIRTRLFTARTQ
jgi:hypothetical protein